MASWQNDFENALYAHVEELMGPSSSALKSAVLYSIQTPGKRIRPLLVADAAAQVQLSASALQALQFTVELIHTFSLVHDDMPCLDNDDWRRGQPTVHKQFGEAQALLTGDQLFQLGVQSLFGAAAELSPTHFVKGSHFLLDCIGSKGLIGGQSTEFEKLGAMSEQELLRVQDQKTTALFRACILTPYYWTGRADSTPEFQDALQFANAFGFAFQVADDLDDIDQDAAAAATGSKAKNILSLMGAQEAKSRARQQLLDCKLTPHFRASEMLMKKLSLPE